MPKNRIKKRRPRRRLKTKSIHDNIKRATVSVLPEIEAYNGERVGLVKREHPPIVIGPEVEPIFNRSTATPAQRFRDKEGVTKRAHDHEARQRFSPEIDEQHRARV